MAGRKNNMPLKKNAAQASPSRPSKAKQAKPAPFTAGAPVRQQPVPVVGIGASAGGLEAFESFFKEMPPDSGIAFVLVSHLDPAHISILPEIIQKSTRMQVQQVTDNMRVAPNHIYIIPPNREMAILNSTLQLLELSKPRGTNLLIDTFFRSLAQDQTDRAIGIILSGTGTDGTLGIRAIKGEAGMVMVQKPESSKFDGMPRSAIATGLVDFILAPSAMPGQLINYLGQTSSDTARILPDDQTMTGDLQKIYLLLRSRTNHDFSLYKKNTICRRIERRMHVHQIDRIADYVRYLQESEREVTILFKEILIGVTNFFRDPEAFALLLNKYLPALLQNRPDNQAIRVWVPGCSSGEEIYSLAIVLEECMNAMGRRFPVQIFGTDLDEEAIRLARSGTYPEAIAADVNPERLKKYFTREETHYQIRKTIRDHVVFAPQNCIKDPPFTNLDLLSCRNLLIYLGPELQKKLLALFHYSLKQDALLFLGSSETVGQASDLFAIQDKKWKIFRRRTARNAVHPVLAFSSPQPTPDALLQIEQEQKPRGKSREPDSQHLMKAILAESDMPACVIIDDAADIIYVHGHTGHFLEPAQGEASSNIIQMARAGLKEALTNAIGRMADMRQEIIAKGLRVKANGGHVDLNLIVRPLSGLQMGRRGLMLVIFDELALPKEKKAVKATPARRVKKDDIQRLRDELQYTRENLQTTIEELETANEELKSTNEELQSTNEELQSTNEEMETSKEELQSINEESATVNAELQSRINELSAAHDDIKNLLDATNIATIFLDIDLCIRRFTPTVTSFIPLIAADAGRPISHFASSLNGINLEQYARQVLADLVMREAEVMDREGKCYRMRVRPYRTLNNVIDGVVVTFEDITELKQLHQANMLAAAVRDSNDAVIMLDCKGGIKAWNRGAEKMYGYSETEALAMSIFDLVPMGRTEEGKALLARLQKEGTGSFITERVRKNSAIVRVWVTMSRLPDEQGGEGLIAATERDLGLLAKESGDLLTGK